MKAPMQIMQNKLKFCLPSIYREYIRHCNVNEGIKQKGFVVLVIDTDMFVRVGASLNW